MAATLDRLRSAFGSVARGADPRAPYGNLYRARVRAQRGPTRVDVEPDDPAIPPMANIPLKVGVPGVEVELVPDHVVMVGWENRRPDRPYATTWTPGTDGTVPSKTTVHTRALELGGPAFEAVPHGTTQDAAIRALVAQQQLLNGVLAALAAALAAPPASTAIGGAAGTAAGAVATVASATAVQTAAFLAGQYLSPTVKTQ
jgi:hypothetical protein